MSARGNVLRKFLDKDAPGWERYLEVRTHLGDGTFGGTKTVLTRSNRRVKRLGLSEESAADAARYAVDEMIRIPAASRKVFAQVFVIDADSAEEWRQDITPGYFSLMEWRVAILENDLRALLGLGVLAYEQARAAA